MPTPAVSRTMQLLQVPRMVVAVQKIRSCISDLSVAPVAGTTVASLSTRGLMALSCRDYQHAQRNNSHSRQIMNFLQRQWQGDSESRRAGTDGFLFGGRIMEF